MSNLEELYDYLNQAFDLYRKDPPETSFQRGYLAALLEIASETGMECGDDLHPMCEEN